MAATGIKVADELVAEFNEFKLKKIASKFIVYKIEDSKIVTDIRGAANSTFDEFMAVLPPNDGRYAVYDYDYTTADGRPANKIVSISWIPDTAPVKKKMLYAGSKDALGSALVGIMVKVQATDASELTNTRLFDECTRY